MTASSARPLVLVVDDEPVNRLVLTRMAEHFGAVCLEACNGAEALSLLAAHPVDLVLLDIHMPQMTGIQVVEQLRASTGPNRDAPVVAVTGDTTRNRGDYTALGFDGYANKPISLSSVETMLQVRRSPAVRFRAAAAG
jgi:CheY-like chemotaxis protein